MTEEGSDEPMTRLVGNLIMIVATMFIIFKSHHWTNIFPSEQVVFSAFASSYAEQKFICCGPSVSCLAISFLLARANCRR